MKLNRLNPQTGDNRSRKRQSASALVIAVLSLSTAIFVGISGVLYASKAKQGKELTEAQAQLQQIGNLRKETVIKGTENAAEVEKLRKERDAAVAARIKAEAELVKAQAELSLLQAGKTRMEAENAKFQIQIATLKLQLKAAEEAGGGVGGAKGISPMTRKQLTAKELCLNNLRQIQGAKKQWAIYERKASDDTPSETDLFGVVKFIKAEPYCPEGGEYKIGKVSEHPTCSHQGHVY